MLWRLTSPCPHVTPCALARARTRVPVSESVMAVSRARCEMLAAGGRTRGQTQHTDRTFTRSTIGATGAQYHAARTARSPSPEGVD